MSHNFVLRVAAQKSLYVTNGFRIKINLTEFDYANYKLNDLSKTVK